MCGQVCRGREVWASFHGSVLPVQVPGCERSLHKLRDYYKVLESTGSSVLEALLQLCLQCAGALAAGLACAGLR